MNDNERFNELIDRLEEVEPGIAKKAYDYSMSVVVINQVLCDVVPPADWMRSKLLAFLKSNVKTDAGLKLVERIDVEFPIKGE